jgi:hypothetical protein
MPDNNPIIVLQTFDSPIEANIIKAKLDAYGIPCFLSEEHLTALTTPLLSGGIRLHIFQHDKEQVVQLLTQESLRKSEEDDLMICPNCKSRRILTMSDDRFDPAAVVKFILQLTKRHYCLDCKTEFGE